MSTTDNDVSTTDNDVWANRVHCALGGLESMNIDADRITLLQAVAARFASRFAPDDRLYEGGEPQWHHRVDEAVDRLVDQRVISRRTSRAARTKRADASEPPLRLTATGKRSVDAACAPAMEQAERRPPTAPSTGQAPDKDPVLGGVLTPPLRKKFVHDPDADAETLQALPDTEPIMIELNLNYGAGVAEAAQQASFLWHLVGGAGEPDKLADHYLTGELSTSQLEAIVSADAAAGDWPKRAIYRIWPDFPARPQIDASGATIKARAAQRTFESFGDGIVWAIVDSGIQRDHPHFLGYQTVNHPSVNDLHRDFTDDSGDPLTDEDGHGTHVAGIIAGGLEKWKSSTRKVIATEKRFNVASPDDGFPIIEPREVTDINRLAGMAPHAKLVSLKVLGGGGDRNTRVSKVMRALAYVREKNAASDTVMRIHGVNLSLGYAFDAEWYACGQSPLCVEVDKLVRSGVVVVVSAGNTGYVTLNPKFATDVTKFSAGTTINDPGNAERFAAGLPGRAAERIVFGGYARGEEQSRTVTFDSDSLTIMIRIDENKDGTEDECASVGGGSKCDEFAQKCTLPFAKRKEKPVVWYIPPMCRYSGTCFAADSARTAAIDTPRIAFAPKRLFVGVPSSAIIA